MNLSISAGELNLLPNFKKKKKGEGRLDMNTIFRLGLLGKMGKIGVRFFRIGVGGGGADFTSDLTRIKVY